MTFATEYFDIIIKVTTFSFLFYFIYLFFFLTTLKIYNSLLLLFCVSCVFLGVWTWCEFHLKEDMYGPSTQ